jgi:hypothetical protein
VRAQTRRRPGTRCQRQEFVEVADVRRRQHGHAQRGRAAAAQAAVEQRVFFGQAVVAPHRQHTGQRHAGERVQVCGPGASSAASPRETVQHKTLQQGCRSGGNSAQVP